MSKTVDPRQFADQKGTIVRGHDGNIVLAEGPTVPSDNAVGYAPGCLFSKRAGAAGQRLYVNEGTAAAADFNSINALATQTGGNVVNGVGSGYKLARGVAAITGSGTVVTGLATVVSIVATQREDASLTNGTTVTASIGDQAGTPAAGSVIIKVWKPTASGDVTPIASAAEVGVNWIAIGT